MDLKLANNQEQALPLAGGIASKVQDFSDYLIRDRTKGSYLEQTAPALKNFLAGLVEEKVANSLSKETVHFLCGKYNYGSFTKDLRFAALELSNLGLGEDVARKVVERTYGTLTSEQKRRLVELPRQQENPVRKLAKIFTATLADPDSYIRGHNLFVKEYKNLKEEVKNTLQLSDPSPILVRIFAHDKAVFWGHETPETESSNTPKASDTSHLETAKLYLDVPSEENETVESKGAEYDSTQSLWRCPQEKTEVFTKWLPKAQPLTTDLIAEFSKALHSYGLVENSVIADGNWQRVAVNSDKNGKKSGSYWLDPLTGIGFIQNFKTGESVTWHSKNQASYKTQPSKALVLNLHLAKEQELRKRYEQVARYCAALWQILEPVNGQNHPYLANKNVSSHELKTTKDGRLAVPLRDIDNKIWTLQFIGDSKRFVKGGKKSGCFYMLGDIENTNKLYIAEGYATAATIYELTKTPVAVAFDAGNLMPVASALKKRYPSLDIIIAADNDHGLAKNVGVLKAEKAALAVAGRVIVPQFNKLKAQTGTDFNDLYLIMGSKDTHQQLMGPAK